MNLRALAPSVSFLVVACTGACTGDRGPRREIAGEVGHIGEPSNSIAFEGTRVYRSYAGTVYTFDVSDPADPVWTDDEAYSGLACGIACDAFVVISNFGYLFNGLELARVPLPNAALPAWIYEFSSNPADLYGYSIAELPGHHLAIGLTEATQSGEIVILDVESAVVIDTIPTTYRPAQVVADSPRLFSFVYKGFEAGPDEIVVNDTAVLSSAFELARIPIELPDGLRIDSIAVSGTNLIVTSTSDHQGNLGVYIGWFRFASDFLSLTRIAETRSFRPAWANPRIIGDSVFVGIDVTSEGGAGETLVLALDTAAGLVVRHRVESRYGFVDDIEIDEQRELVFVGGGQGLQILDLGYLTTGTSSWP